MSDIMLLGHKQTKYWKHSLPHTLYALNPVLYHDLHVKQVSEALITRDSIQVALEVVVKHCIYTFHPSQARLQRGSTLLKLGRLEQAAADFSELVCTCFYSSICIPQNQGAVKVGKAWIIHHKSGHMGLCTPKLESDQSKWIVSIIQKSEALTMLEHLTSWSIVCLLYAAAYICLISTIVTWWRIQGHLIFLLWLLCTIMHEHK